MLASVGNSYGSAPVNTVAPAVTGTATVGSTLTTTNGTWLGSPAPTFTYQWFRSPSTSIGGATSSSYVLVIGDRGFGIFCRVKATNSVAPSGVTADSNTTATVTSVPDAPTIGTATQTGSTTATVVYTAPASDGGTAITSYTATSSPSGITGTLSQAGSGTITVTGLSPSTSYTFTVTATNAVGTSAASAASNSITTALPTIGSAFGGGFFAGQIGVSSVATHNLVVGPKSSAQTTNQWKIEATATAGTSSDIDGPTNSSNMNNASHPCAQFCEALNVGGFSDWYMPAKNELEICYFNLKPNTTLNVTYSGINPNAVPARASNYTTGDPAQTSAAAFITSTGSDFFDAVNYWSSTSSGTLYAKSQQFNAGYQRQDFYKDTSRSVRAVRRVAV
jgi:hypothetical protein